MPERPRRRKNKNKRKNKNLNKSEINKNDDITQSTSGGSENIDSSSITDIKEPTLSDDTQNIVKCDNEKLESTEEAAQKHTPQSTDKLEELAVAENINSEADLDVCHNYVVESPEQTIKSKTKLGNNKSKSLDNDDQPKIIDITDDVDIISEEEKSQEIIDSNSVFISDAESDVEWEVVGDMDDCIVSQVNEVAVGTLNIQTIPLTVAQCEQNQPLTPEEELSLRQYLNTLNLSTHPSTIEVETEIEKTVNCEIKHRLRKKATTNDLFMPRLSLPRHLEVIDEEGSSESSTVSRRQSSINDKKNEYYDDLEDDVFISKNKQIPLKIEKRPKSLHQVIPQECVLVDAKIMGPGTSEASGVWSYETVEKMKGAELVYLTDSSSNASDIYEGGEDTDDGIETDTSVRIITPTIEVTDADKLLRSKVADTESIQIILNDELSRATENPHEIVVLSTENINPSLYVLEAPAATIKENPIEQCENTDSNRESSLKQIGVDATSFDLMTVNIENFKKSDEVSTVNNNENVDYKSNEKAEFKSKPNLDTEIKVLKSELNDVFNNLIKEVSDSEISECNKDGFSRQDSSSSVCSSQCTAKYNPNHASLNDITNDMHDESLNTDAPFSEDTNNININSHVKDVFDCVTGSCITKSQQSVSQHQPLALKDYCVRKIAQLPYGDKILEELASVSERLQNINIVRCKTNDSENINVLKKSAMPYYPLPDVSSIEKVVLPTKHSHVVPNNNVIPPPILPRNSSLKKAQDESKSTWTGLPTKSDPVYVCLSPSQKMLMEKTNTIISKEDATQLVDMHKKYVDRRGYNETYNINDKSDNFRNTPLSIPFKSQTGSRLLAIIRDPAVTNNINTSGNKQRSLDHLQPNKTSHWNKTSVYSKNINGDLTKPNSFRPIPPPRPKKYSTAYESDESSDFTDNSLRSIKSERKYFHYSTGTLNKEIENDISCIQNMHRYYSNTRSKLTDNCPRRPSLPKDLCDQQMEYIRQKEKEIEAEIQRLESKKLNISEGEIRPRAPLLSDKEFLDEKYFDIKSYHISRKRDIAFNTTSQQLPKLDDKKRSYLFNNSQEEIMRDKMYTEYINKMAERQERKEQKVIKITNSPAGESKISKSLSALDILDSKVNNRIEKEFISKARERWTKLGIKDPETEDERENKSKDVYEEPKVITHKIKVIEGAEEKDVQQLPNHLQDFVRFTAKNKEAASSPGESENGPESSHVIVFSVVILVLAIGRYIFHFLRRRIF